MSVDLKYLSKGMQQKCHCLHDAERFHSAEEEYGSATGSSIGCIHSLRTKLELLFVLARNALCTCNHNIMGWHNIGRSANKEKRA